MAERYQTRFVDRESPNWIIQSYDLWIQEEKLRTVYWAQQENFRACFGETAAALSHNFHKKTEKYACSEKHSPQENFAAMQVQITRCQITLLLHHRNFCFEHLHDLLENLVVLGDLFITRKHLIAAGRIFLAMTSIITELTPIIDVLQTQPTAHLSQKLSPHEVIGVFTQVMDSMHSIQTHFVEPPPQVIALSTLIDTPVYRSRIYEGKYGTEDAIIKCQYRPSDPLGHPVKARYVQAAVNSVLRSPYVDEIIFCGIGQGVYKDQFISVMRARGGSIDLQWLSQLWTNLTLIAVQTIITQICIGIDHMHRLGVLHQDLTSMHVTIDRWARIKIIGLNLSTTSLGLYRALYVVPYFQIEGGSSLSPYYLEYTPGYAPPEILDGIRSGRLYDWFSVGATIFNLVTSKLLYEDRDVHTKVGVESEISNNLAQFEITRPNSLTPANKQEILELIKNFVKFNPEERLRNLSLIQAQPFFTGFDSGRFLQGDNSTDLPEIKDTVVRGLSSRSKLAANMPNVDIDFQQPSLSYWENPMFMNPKPEEWFVCEELTNRLLATPSALEDRLMKNLQGEDVPRIW